MLRTSGVLLPLVALALSACTALAPQAKPTSPAATPAAPTPTATPNAAVNALALVPLRLDESPLPPPEPTPIGYTAGRPTPTPFATADTAWKYVTISVGVENRSAEPKLVGIAGSDPSTTNLAEAVLTGGDARRYKPVRTRTSLGMRTATSHALVTYPVLLRLPPGFRMAAESAGSLSVVAPETTSLTFKVPSTLSEYRSLSIPPLANLASKAVEDDVTRRLRPLIGGFAPLDLTGLAAGDHSVTFPLDHLPAGMLGAGGSATGSGVTVTLTGVEAADPDDFEIRNRGWKQLTLSLRYHNDDATNPRAFNVGGWLFGEDGVAYTGDAPTIGDFGRALTPPEPAQLLLWDGRSAGIDLTPAGQALEPRRATFYVPRSLRAAILVLSGDIDATFALDELPSP